VDKPTVFYDTDLTGFGLKAFPSGALSWIVEYRPGAGGRGVAKRRMVLGPSKNVTPEEARSRAAGILAEVRLGGDPAAKRSEARAADNVRDLLASFMDNHVRTKRKPRTAKLFDGYINNHIAPALGTKKAPTLIPFAGALLGRRFASQTDLRTNFYTVALADSGYGKDHARTQIKRLITAAGLERFSGPNRFMSATALRNSVSTKPSCLCMVDEFGGMMRQINDPRPGFTASSFEATCWKCLRARRPSLKALHMPRKPRRRFTIRICASTARQRRTISGHR
jgi:hypothetical protein